MKIKISSTKIFNSFKKFKIFKKQMKIKISSTKVFNSFKKLKIFKKEKKNFINQNFQFLQKNSRAPKFSQKKSSLIKIFNCFTKKKKKKSSLNSSSGIESYDPLLHSPVMQHQVNCPPSTFFEAWSMSQTRGIRQVCQCLFNE